MAQTTKSTKQRFVRISITLPAPMANAIDQAVKSGDTDRSKFFRSAARLKLGKKSSE